MRLRTTFAAAGAALVAAALPASASAFTAQTSVPVGGTMNNAPIGADLQGAAVAYDARGSASADITLDTTTSFPAGAVRAVATFSSLDANGVCGGGGDFLFVSADTNGANPGYRIFPPDDANSPLRTGGATATTTPTNVRLTVSDASLAGRTVNCAIVETVDQSGSTVYDESGTITATPAPAPPSAPGTPAPLPAPPVAGPLATLPGSLISPQRCQRLGGTGLVETRQVPGVGRVRVNLRSNATSPPGTPLRFTLVGARAANVSWTLNGAPVSGTQRRLVLRTATLATRTDHVVGITFTADDGTVTSYPFAFRSLGCDSALSLTQNRQRGRTLVRVRLDATDSVTNVDFPIRSALLRLSGTVKVRTRSANDDRVRTFILRRGATPDPSRPRIAPSGRSTSRITNLPPQTGIVRVDFLTRSTPYGQRRPVTLRGRAVVGGRTINLRTRATGARR